MKGVNKTMGEEWSNNACRGYVIKAMENCGFHAKEIQQVLIELYEVFDFCSVEEAADYFETHTIAAKDLFEKTDAYALDVDQDGNTSVIAIVGKTKGRHRSLGAVLLCFPTETMRELCWQSTHFEKEASMVQSVTYQSETKTVPFQGKTIVLESLTPVLSPKEKEKRKKEIERCLYEVFSKYRAAGDKRH